MSPYFKCLHSSSKPSSFHERMIPFLRKAHAAKKLLNVRYVILFIRFWAYLQHLNPNLRHLQPIDHKWISTQMNSHSFPDWTLVGLWYYLNVINSRSSHKVNDPKAHSSSIWQKLAWRAVAWRADKVAVQEMSRAWPKTGVIGTSLMATSDFIVFEADESNGWNTNLKSVSPILHSTRAIFTSIHGYFLAHSCSIVTTTVMIKITIF